MADLLSPNYWNLNMLFKYRFAVPVYQRPYSWKVSEVDCMLNDIWKSYEEYKRINDEEKQKHCLYVGNLILHRTAFETYDIIDGQQRIATFAIMLLAIYTRLFENNVPVNNRLLIKIQSALWKLDNNDEPILNKRLIDLGSIDKCVLISIFNEAYSQPAKLLNYITNYNISSAFEENVIITFKRTYDFTKDKFLNSNNLIEDLLQLANYILTKVYLIAIINEDSQFKTFSIFESINSKGKRLEDIDLIKTRIFSTLDPADYPSYLSKWGKLIIETEDNLYDYLKIYIKANLKFYSGNITFRNFEMLDKEFCIFFNRTNIKDAYRDLIEDMVNKLNVFKALLYLDKAEDIVINKKYRFYYTMFLKFNYEHPKPLFFRCFCEYLDNKLCKEDLIEIIIETIKFSIIYLSIYSKDSKNVVVVFSSIFKEIYNASCVDKNSILYHIKNKIDSSGIRQNDIISVLEVMDLFSKNKHLGVAVISTYDSFIDCNRLDWDDLYVKFSNYGKSYSLDHIMVQTPSMSDRYLKYYKLGNNLKLKQGHDFPSNLVHDGMEYDNFKSLILHRAGNLTLIGATSNSARGHTSSSTFNTYTQLEARNILVCEYFVINILDIRISSIVVPSSSSTKRSAKLVGNYNYSMNNLNFTGTKPKTLILINELFDVKSHREVYIKILEYLYILDKGKMYQLALNEWSPYKSIILATNQEKLRSSFELVKDEIYIEVNMNANMMFTVTQYLLDIYNIDKTEISIYISD